MVWVHYLSKMSPDVAPHIVNYPAPKEGEPVNDLIAGNIESITICNHPPVSVQKMMLSLQMRFFIITFLFF